MSHGSLLNKPLKLATKTDDLALSSQNRIRVSAAVVSDSKAFGIRACPAEGILGNERYDSQDVEECR